MSAAPARAASRRAGRIGPNAVTRLAEALGAIEGAAAVERVFAAAGYPAHVDQPPADMVEEREATALHRALRCEVGDVRARTIGWMAGRRTGDYLLARRIPRGAQALLRLLPAALAARLLCAAIARNAWTFAGAGEFSARSGHPTILAVRACPLCRAQTSRAPCCDFYAATFERLFAELVDPRARAVETACQALGDPACVFELRWRGTD